MLNDDEPLPTKPRLNTPLLEALGIEELETYIRELRGEIARAEAQIAGKRDHRSAADSVFRRT